MTRSESTPLALTRRTPLLASLLDGFGRALTRRRERQLLSRLDSHLLRDIGLTPDQARMECDKPFWRP